MRIFLRRYRCILTQTLVCLQILLYTHYPFLSLCCYCFASFYLLNSWNRLFYYQRNIYVGDCILLTKNTQKIFCLLLLCGISELQDNKYTMITERIRNIFVYDKNLHARKIFHKTVEMYLKYTNRYTHIYMQFGKITFQVLQNTESNTLPSELLIRIRKIINEKM